MSKEFIALEKMWNRLLHNKVDEAEKYFDIVEKSLKRNETMKIIQTSNEQDFSLFDCPNCETTMYYESAPEDWKYCIECGQALDWSGSSE